MTANELDSLKENLKTHNFANSKDVKKLLKYIKQEIITRRHQTMALIEDDELTVNEDFDTARIANNIIKAFKKINPSKWEYVIQNITFIKLALQLIDKLKKLITYEEYTPYNDHAGCDAQCTGLCASCSGTCTGSNAGISGGGNGDWNGAIGSKTLESSTIYQINFPGVHLEGTLVTLPDGRIGLQLSDDSIITGIDISDNPTTDSGVISPA